MWGGIEQDVCGGGLSRTCVGGIEQDVCGGGIEQDVCGGGLSRTCVGSWLMMCAWIVFSYINNCDIINVSILSQETRSPPTLLHHCE